MKREEINARGIAYVVTTWDDETGDAEVVEFDASDQQIRRGVITYWPEERREKVIGEAVWFDADGNEIRRTPLKLQAC